MSYGYENVSAIEEKSNSMKQEQLRSYEEARQLEATLCRRPDRVDHDSVVDALNLDNDRMQELAGLKSPKKYAGEKSCPEQPSDLYFSFLARMQANGVSADVGATLALELLKIERWIR